MHQFALFAGLIITALILNTAAFLLSVFLLYTLPVGVTSSVTAYAGILIALNLLAWLILLGGGAAILHQEREGHAPMALKLGIMLTVLFLFTIVFILSCILLSVFQNDLQASLVAPRNYTASVLALVFVAWTLILSGSALLAQGGAAPVVVAAVPRPYMPQRSQVSDYMSPRRQSSYMMPTSSGRYYGMTRGAGRTYSMKSY